MYGSYHGYGAYGQLLDYRPLFKQHWHSPHYKYSEILGGTYHIPHSRFPPHDVYRTPWFLIFILKVNNLGNCLIIAIDRVFYKNFLIKYFL